MNKKVRVVFLVTALVMEFFLLSAGINIITALIIIFITLLGGYTVWWVWTTNRLMKILDRQCDPEKFIEEYINFKKISNRPAFNKFCNVNIAAGLTALNRNEEALEILLSEIGSDVKSSRQIEAACHINFFVCCLNLGYLEKAEKEFENYIKDLITKQFHYRLLGSVYEALAYYQYLNCKTGEAAKLFLEQLDFIDKIYKKRRNKRGRLEVIYRKAETLYGLEDFESAVKKYKTVAENGGSLWVAEASRQKLKEYEDSSQ